MTSIGARHLLIGGFDGKSTFGDLWWLVPEGILLLFVLLSYSNLAIILCTRIISYLSLESLQTN